MDEALQDFALITEGVTDHAILSNVLVGYFKNQREPEINRLHPNPLADDEQGGWTVLLEFLRAKRFQPALRANRYLIVQVDTDVTEDPGFDVAKQDNDGPLSPEKLIAKVIERLRQEIGELDWSESGDRFIFAVGVEQMECWVLPIWYRDAKGKQTANCTKRLGDCSQLRDRLTAKKLRWIKKKQKDTNSYDVASEAYRHRSTLMREGPKNPSLKIFLDALEARQIVLPPVD